MGLVTGISSAAVFMATMAFSMVTILSITIDCTSWVVYLIVVEDYAKAMRLNRSGEGFATCTATAMNQSVQSHKFYNLSSYM